MTDSAKASLTFPKADGGRFRGLSRFILAYPVMAAGFGILVAIALASVLAPLLGTVDPAAVAVARSIRPPSFVSPFGTDMLGRDLYSRTLFGGQTSLLIGLTVAALVTVIGGFLGLISGFIRSVDGPLTAVMDGLIAIPSILIAIALMAATQGSVTNVILAITIAEIPRMTRVVRGEVLSLRERSFIDAALTSGSRTHSIIIKHLAPNVVAPSLVQATYVCATAILSESLLSFIGAGVPSTTPTWGNIIADGKQLWQIAPHIVFIPALFLSVTVLGINFVGDGLRDILDPRSGAGE